MTDRKFKAMFTNILIRLKKRVEDIRENFNNKISKRTNQ